MGIYIKHMKMPNSCVECPLYKELTCDAFETLAPYTFKDNERASFCPLIVSSEDIVSVVRCKDCHWWNSEMNGCKRNPSVEAWYETDFCGYGERR